MSEDAPRKPKPPCCVCGSEIETPYWLPEHPTCVRCHNREEYARFSERLRERIEDLVSQSPATAKRTH